MINTRIVVQAGLGINMKPYLKYNQSGSWTQVYSSQKICETNTCYLWDEEDHGRGGGEGDLWDSISMENSCVW
jgi:hypothetical protein